MPRTTGWVALVAPAGARLARTANDRYGSPLATESSRNGSPLNAAAMATSWLDQSMYAIALPGPGLINPRNHTEGPKMNRFADGVFRPDDAPNGESMVRFRPSAPTARFSRR